MFPICYTRRIMLRSCLYHAQKQSNRLHLTSRLHFYNVLRNIQTGCFTQHAQYLAIRKYFVNSSDCAQYRWFIPIRHRRQIFQYPKTDISIYILIILMNNHFDAPMAFSNGMSQIHTSQCLYVSMFIRLNVFTSQCLYVS